MRRYLCAVLTLLLALAVLSPAVSAEQARSPAEAYRVIVNAKNPISSVRRTFLEDAFLKKTSRWPSGRVIRPADLAPRSAVRTRFSAEVLRRPTAAVKAYWQQRIFSGRDVPPPEFDDDERMVAYVSKHEGAVGYVSAVSSIGDTRVLTVTK